MSSRYWGTQKLKNKIVNCHQQIRYLAPEIITTRREKVDSRFTKKRYQYYGNKNNFDGHLLFLMGGHEFC